MDVNTFTFGTFKEVMDISDISEETYAFILRAVFKYVLKVHSIDLEEFVDNEVVLAVGEEPTFIPIPEDLQYAVFKHAKYLYEIQVKGVEIIDSVKDSGGNTSRFREAKLPALITSTYRMYSPIEPIILT